MKHVKNITTNKFFIPILIVIGIFYIRSNVVSHYYIPSGSMYPNLEYNDIVIGDVVKDSNKNLTRGLIYVFKFKDDNKQSNMVKRLLGKPYDTISYRSKENSFFVNGQKIQVSEVNPDPETLLKLKERYGHDQFTFYKERSLDGVEYTAIYSDLSFHNKDTVHKYLTKDFTYTLKENEYFFVGDNRNYSVDSRYYGVVKREDIKTNIDYILVNRELIFNPKQRFFFNRI